VAVACGMEIGPREASGVGVVGLEIGMAASEVSVCFFSRVGGISVVECLPVVHGGMARNSSKVKTLGLQHFHPCDMSVYEITRNYTVDGKSSTNPFALRER
jgi:hypothetical protein